MTNQQIADILIVFTQNPKAVIHIDNIATIGNYNTGFFHIIDLNINLAVIKALINRDLFDVRKDHSYQAYIIAYIPD